MTKTITTGKWRVSLLLGTAALTLAACEVGPDYERPVTEASASYKEMPQNVADTASPDWKPAAPQDDTDRGDWWLIYQDATLNDLEQQIDISNQNLKASEASYRAAVALADQTRAGLFPTVALNGGVTRAQAAAPRAPVITSYDLSASANWTIDIWGRIRRQVENAEHLAEASAADLASARLSAEAELATDYFSLRTQDELQRILDENVLDDEKILKIVQNQYNAGTVASSDLLAARTQLESTRASAINVGVRRGQLEHAIAILIGKAPADFALGASKTIGVVPPIPPALPSHLLERRPDIAAAERQMAAANANIGVAEAAWYPELSLSAVAGFTSPILARLFQSSNSMWSFGPSVSETLIDFGAREALVAQAEANYDQTVATYRQTVLTGFQQVEDNLIALRILADQARAEDLAVNDARKSEAIALNQYKQGIVPYNNVLTAQITRLSNEQAALTVLGNRLSASVALVEALGGGWDAASLHKDDE
jgi:NodT family efflux transporter outer membrane factor (OMF) lipoprotein